MSSEIKCINDHDDFCFVCGTRVFHIKKKGEIPKMRYIDGPKFVEGYQQLFNRNPLDRIVDWSPRISCDTCFTKMTHPTRLQNIESPMEWFAPVDHPNDCFFCQTVVPPGTNKRRAGSIQYADVPAVKKPKFTHEEADDYFDDDGDFNIDAIVEDIVEDIVGDSSVAVPPAENEPSDETVNVAEEVNSILERLQPVMHRVLHLILEHLRPVMHHQVAANSHCQSTTVIFSHAKRKKVLS